MHSSHKNLHTHTHTNTHTAVSKFPTDTPTIINLVDRHHRVISPISSLSSSPFTPQSNNDLLQWQVPQDLPTGWYVLKGAPASNLGVVAMSSLVRVVDKEARRKGRGRRR